MSVPTILAVDTSTERLGVALLHGDTSVHRHLELGTGHANVALSVIDEVLAEAGVDRTNIDAIAVCRGPGGFTGLRIAMGIAQGLALALEVPVVPVSGLRVLAAAAPAGMPVLALIDARMGEFYAAAWSDRAAAAADAPPLLPECVAGPEVLLESLVEAGWPAGQGAAVGPGVASGLLAKKSPVGASLLAIPGWPDARVLAQLGRADLLRGKGVPAEDAQPVYLRDRVAVPSIPRVS